MRNSAVTKTFWGLLLLLAGGVWGEGSVLSGRVTSIHVGAILPLSGAISVYGNNEGKGIQLAMEEFNSQRSSTGLQVSVDYRDDGFKPDRTVAELKNLVSDSNTVAILGALTSNCTLAMAPLAQAARIPVVTPSSTNDRIVGSSDFIFQACYRDGFQGDVAAKFAFDTLKAKTAVILVNPDSDYSEGLTKAFLRRFGSLGGSAVTVEYRSDSSDFHEQARQTKAINPDCVILTDYLHPLAEIAQALRGAGVLAPFVGSDSWDDVVSNNAAGFSGSYYVNHYWEGTDSVANDTFRAAYRKRWGVDPDALAALGYDAAKILFDAIYRAYLGGEVTRDSVKYTLGQTDGDFATGHIRFDGSRDTVKTACILKVETDANGRLATSYVMGISP